MDPQMIARMAVALHRMIDAVYTEKSGVFPIDSLPEECVAHMEAVTDLFFDDDWDSLAATTIGLQEQQSVIDESNNESTGE